MTNRHVHSNSLATVGCPPMMYSQKSTCTHTHTGLQAALHVKCVEVTYRRFISSLGTAVKQLALIKSIFTLFTMPTENQIIAATDKILLEKNQNKFKRLLNEQKTAHLPFQCSALAFDKRHLQTSSEGLEEEMILRGPSHF